jgi:hypothetical protein
MQVKILYNKKAKIILNRNISIINLANGGFIKC